MNSTGTAAREWTTEEVTRGLELFEAGASIRKLSLELNVSRHQAEKFTRACKASEAKSKPAPDYPPGVFAQVTPEDGVPRPRSAAVYEPPKDLESLQRTRAELKSKLDRAAQLGDRAGVSTYSLALARLNSTSDPGATPDGESTIDFSHLPEWALDVLELILRSVAVDDNGAATQAGRSPAEQKRWAKYEKAFAGVT